MSEAVRRDDGRRIAEGLATRLARRAVVARLSALEAGDLLLVEGSEALRFGRDGDGRRAEVTVRDPRFWQAVALGGTVGAAEAYAEGWWDADDLVALVRLVVAGARAGATLESGLAKAGALAWRLRHLLRRNTRTGAQDNVRDHYDLGNDFFRLLLDETMTYSCGIFERPGMSLRDASVAKLERVCRKLELRPGLHVLEIGTGWGSFALHAAKAHGVRVTTTTLSREQHALAGQRIREAGLGGKVEVQLSDYRDLRGSYDRLVSIEMVEAVGWQYYQPFFGACAARLRDDGMMLLQGITLPDQVFERQKDEVDHIKAHIFPGTCIPSTTALCQAAAQAGDLRLHHLEEIGPHYAPTLRAWRENLVAHWEQALRLGKTERFLRMFEYYLAYCEAAFEERYLGDVQMLFVKPGCRREPLLPALRGVTAS
jgi:cyclopropane-fatty-acyl-phospholipid synthase